MKLKFNTLDFPDVDNPEASLWQLTSGGEMSDSPFGSGHSLAFHHDGIRRLETRDVNLVDAGFVEFIRPSVYLNRTGCFHVADSSSFTWISASRSRKVLICPIPAVQMMPGTFCWNIPPTEASSGLCYKFSGVVVVVKPVPKCTTSLYHPGHHLPARDSGGLSRAKSPTAKATSG